MKVALIGLDGSGKSANINLMKEDAAYEGFRFMWVRWRPSITLWLYRLRHKNDKVGARQNNESGQKKQKALEKDYARKKGIKNFVFRLGLFKKLWFAYAIRDYKHQFQQTTEAAVRENANMIFDRYYLDLFVDQGINFGYSPEKIYREIEKYKADFPAMDKIVYIKVAPAVCFARKDDIPNMEYLNRRYEIYEYIAKKQKWHIVDGEQPLDTVYRCIKAEILG